MKISSIRQELIDHPSNAWAKQKGYSPLFQAHRDARIVLIGQAPGVRAQKSGVAWDDLSGDRLRNWLGLSKEVFYDETQVALLPMDFYYPGKGKSGDLPPRKEFASLWHPKLFACMPYIQLRVLLGQYAQKAYLGQDWGPNLTETVRQAKVYLERGLFPLPHPSPRNNIWLKKNPWFEKMVLPELKKTIQKMI